MAPGKRGLQLPRMERTMMTVDWFAREMINGRRSHVPLKSGSQGFHLNLVPSLSAPKQTFDLSHSGPGVLSWFTSSRNPANAPP